MPNDDFVSPDTSEDASPEASENVAVENNRNQNSSQNELEQALQRIDQLEVELEKAKEKELRLMADVQNVRRRMEDDRSSLIFESAKKILSEILPMLDNFERALEHTPEDMKDHEWIKGILVIHQHMTETLKKQGVEVISDTGTDLDPQKHEAVMMDPEGEEGKVTKILAKGYLYMGKVLRPAQVAVGSGPAK